MFWWVLTASGCINQMASSKLLLESYQIRVFWGEYPYKNKNIQILDVSQSNKTCIEMKNPNRNWNYHRNCNLASGKMGVFLIESYLVKTRKT